MMFFIRTVFKWKDQSARHPSWVCLPHIFTLHRNKLKAFTRFIRLVVVKLTAVRREGDTVSRHIPPPGPWWSGDVTLCHDVSHAGLRAPDHADGPPGASLTLGDHSLSLASALDTAQLSSELGLTSH